MIPADMPPQDGEKLDRESSIPLYQQLKDILRQQIELGVFHSGRRLPSEEDLCRRYGVSRITIRQALQSLSSEGLLVRGKGRGLIVALPKFQKPLSRFSGLAEDMTAYNVQSQPKLLEAKVVVPSAKISGSLGLGPSEGVFRLTRLWLADKQPVAFKIHYVPERFCPEIGSCLADQPLYRVMEARYNILVTSARQVIEVTVASSFEANLLQVEAGSPVILWEGVAFSQDGRAVEYFRSLYRPDRFRFSFTSQR